MATKKNFLELTDQELIIKIREDSRYLSVVEKRYKVNCKNFVRWKLNRNFSIVDLEEMFQDACLVLYENIKKGDFVLTHKLQTYLNSVCYNNIFNRMKKMDKLNKIQINVDDSENFYDELPDLDDYDSSIKDFLIIASDNLEIKSLKSALQIIKDSGGNCFDLLTLFWYPPKISIKELTEIFGYTSEVNTRNQKARCQKRLKIIMQKELNNEISN